MSIQAKAKAAGIKPSVVYQRMKMGWDEEKALSTPVRPRRPNQKRKVPDGPFVSMSAFKDLQAQIEKDQRRCRRMQIVTIIALTGFLISVLN